MKNLKDIQNNLNETHIVNALTQQNIKGGLGDPPPFGEYRSSLLGDPPPFGENRSSLVGDPPPFGAF